MNREIKKIGLFALIFLFFYFLPVDSETFRTAFLSGISLLSEYAREHVLTCLLPAFFIAGALAVFVRKDVIIRYLSGQAKKIVSYSLASVSGTVLAVCSCTILPIFAGIRKMGAGLGPAITFLFSGPAINVAAMFLTISVLGPGLGFARIFFAVFISILAGLSMQAIFREKPEDNKTFFEEYKEVGVDKKLLVIFFTALVGILVVSGLRVDPVLKYGLVGIFIAAVAFISIVKLHRETTRQWLEETWGFARMLLPLLFAGIFIAGFITPILPESLIQKAIGDNSVLGNSIAAVFGALIYFSTLTEVPIIQALISKGMHQGPALTLLLAGPSVSLPNLLVVRKILGNKKTAVYAILVVVYSSIAGFTFGALF